MVLRLALEFPRRANANFLARTCSDGVLLYYCIGMVSTTRKISRFSMKFYGVQRAGFGALKERLRGEEETCLLIQETANHRLHLGISSLADPGVTDGPLNCGATRRLLVVIHTAVDTGW